MIVGKIGGRRLPLVAADLLKYRLGARLYAGPPAQLVRSELPAPVQPVLSGPGPLRLMVRKGRRGLRRLRKKRRKDGERRNGRMRWFGKRRQKGGGNSQSSRAETLESRLRKPRGGWIAIVAATVLAVAAVAVPQSALADGHWARRDRLRDNRAGPRTKDIRRGADGLRRPGRRNPKSSHQHRPASEGIRRPGRRLAPLLGIGHVGAGGAGRLLAPPARSQAVLHLLVGGQPRTGRGRHLQARADPVPPPRRRRRAVHRQACLPGLDSGSH